MQRFVDREILACASWALLRGSKVVGQDFVGWADRETRIPL
jgi:hypothetical protein